MDADNSKKTQKKSQKKININYFKDIFRKIRLPRRILAGHFLAFEQLKKMG